MVSIPKPVLSKFPQFDEDAFQTLKILHHRVKAKIRQTEKRLQNSTVANERNDSFDSSETTTYSNQLSNVDLVSDNKCISKNLAHERKNHPSQSNMVADDKNNIYNTSTIYDLDTTSEQCNSSLELGDDPPGSKNFIPKEQITPIQTKRKNQFQLKVPVKATVSPEMSKKLEEMMEKSNRTKVENNEDKFIMNKVNAPSTNKSSVLNLILGTGGTSMPEKLNLQNINKNVRTTVYADSKNATESSWDDSLEIFGKI